jgi:hypothetical protein
MCYAHARRTRGAQVADPELKIQYSPKVWDLLAHYGSPAQKPKKRGGRPIGPAVKRRVDGGDKLQFRLQAGSGAGAGTAAVAVAAAATAATPMRAADTMQSRPPRGERYGKARFFQPHAAPAEPRPALQSVTSPPLGQSARRADHPHVHVSAPHTSLFPASVTRLAKQERPARPPEPRLGQLPDYQSNDG